jgi:2-dehydropantoate 2-reductase
VSLQNGLCELEIAKVVGASRTVGAFVNFSAEVLQPGHVHFAQPESFAIALGEIDGTESARVAELSDLLGSFAPVRPTTNIWGFLWAKLGYANMLFATGVTPEPMGDVIERYPALMVELACEIYDVATAEGVTLEAFDNVRPEIYYPREGRRSAEVDATIAMLVAHRRRNAMTRSGVWRDLAVRHVPTEVDSQLGLAVAIGSGWGLKLPLTQRLVEIVHSIERGKMALSMQNVEGLEAKRRELVRDPPDPQETVALEGDKTIAG